MRIIKWKKIKLYEKNDSLKFTIYEHYFNSFFQKYEKKLLLQDIYLDTPLHKIAKLNDKLFFLEICKKLHDLRILNEELLSIKNIKGEDIFNYIFLEIKNNYNCLMLKDKYKYKYEKYKNFILMKNSSYQSILNNLQGDKKKLLYEFITNN